MTIASVTITPATTKTTARAATTGTGDTAGDLFAMLAAAFFPQLSLAAGDVDLSATGNAGATVATATAAGAAGATATAVATTSPSATPLAAAGIDGSNAAGLAGAAGVTTTPGVEIATAATVATPEVLAGLGAVTITDPSNPAGATPRTSSPTGEQGAAPPAADATVIQAGDAPDPRLALGRHAAANVHADTHGDDDHDDKGRHEGHGRTDAPGRAVSALATSGPRLQAATRHDQDQDAGDDTASADAAAKPAPAVAAPRATAPDDHDPDGSTDLHVSGTSSVAGPPRATTIDAPAPTPPAPPSRPVDVPAHQQITAAVGGLRQRGDGTYHLNVHLHPADLGPVDLDVQLHHDSIELHMHAEHEHARELLTDHIAEIRHELEQLGLQATTVDVGDGSRRQRMPAAPAPTGFTPLGSDVPANPATPVTPVTAPATADSALDVRI